MKGNNVADTSVIFDIQSLGNIANSLSAAATLEDLALKVEEILDQYIHVEYSGLYLYDPQENRLKLLYAKGFSKDEIIESQKSAMERHPGKVFKEAKELSIPDITQDNTNLSSDSKRSFVVRSRLFLPVIVNNECVGTFGLASSLPNRFTDIDRNVLNFVSGLAAIVYKNIISYIEIQKNVSRLSSLISSLKDAILVENEQRQIVLLNKEFCNLFEIPLEPEQLIGFDCSASADESKHLFENPEKFVSRINEILSEKKYVKGEILNLKNGSMLERDYIPVYFNGVYFGHMWKYADISERIAKQKELQLFEKAISHSTNGIVIIDAKADDYPVIYVNATFEDFTGYSRNDVIGKNLRFLHQGDRDQPGLAIIKDALKNKAKAVANLRNYKKDGSIFWVELYVYPIFNNEGNLTHYVGIEKDITESVKSSKELFDHKEIADGVALASNYLLKIYNIDLAMPLALEALGDKIGAERITVKKINPYSEIENSYNKIWKFQSKDSLASDVVYSSLQQNFDTKIKIFDMLESHRGIISIIGDQLSDDQKQLLSDFDLKSLIMVPIYLYGKIWGIIRIENIEHTLYWSDYYNSIFTTFAATISGALSRKDTENDLLHSKTELSEYVEKLVTSRSELEQATGLLIQQEKMATLGMIASSIAHEINSPLGAILNSAERLLEKSLPKESINKNLNLIMNAATSSKRVIEKLLVSVRQSTVDSNCEIKQILEDWIDLYGIQLSHLGIDIKIDVPNRYNIPISYSDFNQVLTNIILNAKDALSEYDLVEDKVISVKFAEDNEYYILKISDNGPGIDSAILDKIFDAFVTSKEAGKGTGLGLWISKSLIEKAGGELIAGNSDEGAIFTIKFKINKLTETEK